MPRAGTSARARTTTGIDLDIELAKKQSAENPVYYVQYAHARCARSCARAADEELAPDARDAAQLLVHPAEQALIRRLLAMPDVVADAAERRETHELTHYLPGGRAALQRLLPRLPGPAR